MSFRVRRRGPCRLPAAGVGGSPWHTSSQVVLQVVLHASKLKSMLLGGDIRPQTRDTGRGAARELVALPLPGMHAILRQ